MLKLYSIFAGLFICTSSLAQATLPHAYVEASFNAKDGRVPQSFLDSINQGLSIQVNGAYLNTVQLKQRKDRSLSVSGYITAERWDHLCAESDSVEHWAESKCKAFESLSISEGECGRHEWCLKFRIAKFVRDDPRLLEIVRNAIASPCAYAEATEPLPSPKIGGRGILPPGQARKWLLCDAQNSVYGTKKSESADGVFVLSISRKN